MIYRSNLTAPDLAPDFTMLSRPWHDSMGHDAPADPDFDPNCGWLTHDEAAILYNVAERLAEPIVGGVWLDIGCRAGWTTAHLRAAGNQVVAVDPMLSDPEFKLRFYSNLQKHAGLGLISVAGTSAQFFDWLPGISPRYYGVMIDGDHDSPQPLYDAQRALGVLRETGAIVFHDVLGAPVRDGVKWLVAQGLKCKIYWTPRVMAVCYRGDFVPPVHQRDPSIDWKSVEARISDLKGWL